MKNDFPAMMKENMPAHMHNVDHVKKHYAEGGHMHHQEHVSKMCGSDGHKMHHEHVKAMCGGGMTKR
jgi:hypothetical protein